VNKEIDIDNEEQILTECDFDYYYKSICPRELCMFFNDITRQSSNFDKKQARIDLGRIAITLNRMAKQLENNEKEIRKQVCKEIRKVGINSFDALTQEEEIFITGSDLDKIEKGK
jgi:hypothetical protein